MANIPKLAAALLQCIEDEQHTNQHFSQALEHIITLCQESLNPNISMDDIKKMLVQHLLTSPLFHTIFDNPNFTRYNVLAAEIEKIIHTLTNCAFTHNDVLQQFDGIFTTKEKSNPTNSDFSEKQALLNTVYERFFQGFSQKQADTYGIVYTPQEIVDFMCASVDEVLQREFDKTLSSTGVNIFDPCVGIGNFMVNIIHRLSLRTIQHKYQHELLCNEVMLLPYYIASLNIEHAYYERTQEYLPFTGIKLKDTLEPDYNQQQRQDLLVIIGNPPYNAGQVSENDNNKNRQYSEIDQRIRETYRQDSQATLKNKLYDMYVRFFRWATDRLDGQDGIVCFVSNNGFLQGIAFDGFRKHLAQDFTHIYHLDLGGNARREGGGSVFGIRVGVGITLLIRNAAHTTQQIDYYQVPQAWTREQKLAFLADKRSIGAIQWKTLSPGANHTWLTQGLQTDFATFLPIGTKQAKAKRVHNPQTIFKQFSLGVSTNRDTIVYDFDKTCLTTRVEYFIEAYNAEVSRWVRAGRPKEVEDFVNYTTVKWSYMLKQALKREGYAAMDTSHIRQIHYRPFTKKYLYYSRPLVDAPGLHQRFFPTPACEQENMGICVAGVGDRKGFGSLVTNTIPSLDIAFEKAQCFPFYTYDENGNNRRENITDWALEQAQSRYGEGVGKWDIFHYTYAMLHHPTYRERYADNLRLELPRIPLLADSEAWHTLVTLGKQLVDLHLHYEHVAEYPLEWRETRNVPWTWRVEQMRLTPDKDAVVVNDALTLAGIPPGCFAYRLGNRSALEWVIDQYRVRIDPRSGITSDPNSEDDQEYIVRLVGRVVQVSVETVALVGQVAAVELC